MIVAPFERGLEHGGSQRATAMAERLEERGASVEWRVLNARPISNAQRLRAAASMRPAATGMYPSLEANPPSVDAAVAVHSYLAPKLAPLPRDVVRVIDFQDLEWHHLADSASFAGGIRRAYQSMQVVLMRRFERAVVAGGPLCLFTSENELAWARGASSSGSDAFVVPSVLPRAAEAAALALGERTRGAARLELAYVGTVRFPPNLGALREFLAHAWPAIRTAAPGVQLTIAGDCSAEDRISLSAHPGVEALGFVDDIGPLLERSAAVIMPITGKAGTSLRALYYALAGIEVIGTAAAFRGLSWRMGTVVDSPEDWARAVRRAIDEGAPSDGGVETARAAALALQQDPDPWDELHRRIGELVRERSRA